MTRFRNEKRIQSGYKHELHGNPQEKYDMFMTNSAIARLGK
jgi:hypothetical protein